ncbi:hypothetical protein P7K49_024438 [Saguinus oedipus]|uniref:Rhodanese domain-containing protein n=1 Tax=Saguinus oedipus TaxID=9490 RepID=A0ABQ9UPH4_SAGOE|nr:hypothetical protein P7K49_024438 [Saguinus oedipus]
MGSRVTGGTHSHKTVRAGGIPGFWGCEQPAWVCAAARAPGESPSRASPAGTLAVGTRGARGAGPLGGGGGSMKVTSLDGRQLRKMLRKEAAARCVVLDCRPYLAFAASSVRGSLNVNLNSVVLRRARGGTVSARYVLPDEAARARLLQEGGGGVAAVVVLDQGSRHWQKLREESAARVVLTSLLACLPAGPRVYFLKGERAGSLPHSPLPRSRVPSLRRGALLYTSGPRESPPTGVCTLGFDVRLEGHCKCRRSELPRSPPVFLESAWQPVCPPGWVELVMPRGLLLLSSSGAVGSCWARAPFPDASFAAVAGVSARGLSDRLIWLDQQPGADTLGCNSDGDQSSVQGAGAES